MSKVRPFIGSLLAMRANLGGRVGAIVLGPRRISGCNHKTRLPFFVFFAA
jgi:hypothetical protein